MDVLLVKNQSLIVSPVNKGLNILDMDAIKFAQLEPIKNIIHVKFAKIIV